MMRRTRPIRRSTCVARLIVAVAMCASGVSVALADGVSSDVRVNAPASIRDHSTNPNDTKIASETLQSETLQEEEPLLRRQPTRERDVKTGASDGVGIRLPETSMVDTFWPMLVVLGLIMACGALARKWLPQATRASGGGAVNVLARQYLSSKQSLCLIKVGKRVVLVGVTPESMSTLTQIDDPEEIASLAATLNRGKSDAFEAALSKQADDQNDSASIDEEPAALERNSGGRFNETETRIRELVGRIRAMSTGSSQ